VLAWWALRAMFKFTNIVMHYAPIGVGAAIAYTVGPAISVSSTTWHGRRSFLWSAGGSDPRCLSPIALIFGVPIRKFVRAVKGRRSLHFRPPQARPRCRGRGSARTARRPRRIVSFVLPLGTLQSRRNDPVFIARSVFVAQAAGCISRLADHNASR
jgi:proton glutamate symport protein